MDVNPGAQQQEQPENSKEKQNFSNELKSTQQSEPSPKDIVQNQGQQMDAEPPYAGFGNQYDLNQYVNELPTVKVPNNKISNYESQQFWPNYYGGNFKVMDNYFLYRELSNEYTSNLAPQSTDQQTDISNPNLIKSELTGQNIQQSTQTLSQSNFNREMSSFDLKSDVKYEKDDEQQDAKNSRKPHLQGRFSGRLEKKEDEKRLVDECRMLAAYIGGQGKRGDKSRSTLAKIVRGIACGDVRRHLQEQANRVQTLAQKFEQLKYLRHKEQQEFQHQQHLIKQELLKKCAIIGEYEKKHGQLQNIDLTGQLQDNQNQLQQVMESQLMNNSMQTSHTHLSHWSQILGNGQNFGNSNHGQYANILSSSNTPTEGQFKMEHVPYIGPASTPGALSAPNTPHNYNTQLNLSQLANHNASYPWGSRHADMQNLSKTSSLRDVDFANGMEGNGSNISQVQRAAGQVAQTAQEAQAGAQQYNFQASKLQNIADERAQQAKAQEQAIQQNNAQLNKLMSQADEISSCSGLPDAQIKVYQQNIEEKLSNVNHQNQKLQQQRSSLMVQAQTFQQEAEKARHKAQDLQHKASELNTTVQVLQSNASLGKAEFQSILGQFHSQSTTNPVTNPLSRHNSQNLRVTELAQISDPNLQVGNLNQGQRFGGQFSQPELSTGQVSSLQRQFSGHNISSISQQGVPGVQSNRATPQTTPVQTPRGNYSQGQSKQFQQSQRTQQGGQETMGSTGLDGQVLSSNPSASYIHSQLTKPRSFTNQNSNSNNSNPNLGINKNGIHHSSSYQSLTNQDQKLPNSQSQFPPPPPQRPPPHTQGINPLFNKATEYVSPRTLAQQQIYNRVRKSQSVGPNAVASQMSNDSNMMGQQQKGLEPLIDSMGEQNRQYHQSVYEPLVRHASINYPKGSNLVDRLMEKKNNMQEKFEEQNLSFKVPQANQEFGGEGNGQMFRSISMHKFPVQSSGGSEALLQQAYHDHNLMLHEQGVDLGSLKASQDTQQAPNILSKGQDHSTKQQKQNLIPQARDMLQGPQDNYQQGQGGSQQDQLMLLESPLQEVIHHTIDSDINQYLISNNSDQQISFNQDIPRSNNNQSNAEEQQMDLSLHGENQ